jgi:hypothetical protein
VECEETDAVCWIGEVGESHKYSFIVFVFVVYSVTEFNRPFLAPLKRSFLWVWRLVELELALDIDLDLADPVPVPDAVPKRRELRRE